MQPDDLEELVDRHLRQLPVPEAPDTLLPRVMSSVLRRSSRPWHARGWFAWPAAWQVGSMAVLVLGLVVVLETLPLSFELIGRGLTGAVASAGVSADAWTVTQVVWRTFVRPALPYALGLALITASTCALGGAALMHLGLGKAAPR
jgi:hypothetical protein